MLVHVALDEHGAAVGVEAHGEEHLGKREGVGTQCLGVVGDREGVQVDYAVDGVGLVLEGDPVVECPQQISEVYVAGGLDAREDPCHGRSGYRCGAGVVGTAQPKQPAASWLLKMYSMRSAVPVPNWALISALACRARMYSLWRPLQSGMEAMLSRKAL